MWHLFLLLEVMPSMHTGKKAASVIESVPGLVDDVWSLQKAGYSIEEIARKLGKGQTEVELFLTFTRE